MAKLRHRRRVSRAALAGWGITLLAISTLAAVAASPLPQAVELIEQELRSRASHPQALRIAIDTSRIEHQPACSRLEVNLAPHIRLRPSMSIPLRCLEPERWQASVQARVEMPGTYVVASRSIQPGEALDSSNLEVLHGDLLTLPAGVVQDLQSLQGQVASRRIGSGQMVRDNSIRSALAVQRGQTVRLRVRGTSFVAMGEGQAMENAKPGTTLQVRTASGQIVSGVLQDDGVVDIAM